MAGSAPGQYYSGSSCYWKIGSPGEWTSNSIFYIQIIRLKNAKCFLNYGGYQTAKGQGAFADVGVMNEKECKESDVIELKYTDFSYEANIFLVSYALFKDEEKTENQLATIEFEYWVENIDDYPDLVNKGFLAFLLSGLVLCGCMVFLFKNGVKEILENEVQLKVWKLVGKPKLYVEENAPTVLTMVQDAEKVMEVKPDDKGKPLRKTKEMLLRELKNDLEEPWCCLESLAPVKNLKVAVFFFLMNFFFPGLGTLFSGVCIPEPVVEKPKEEEDDALEGLKEDDEDEETEEAKA